MQATQLPNTPAANFASAIGTGMTIDGKAFTVTADDRLFFGDSDVLLSADDANLARHLAAQEECGALRVMFDAYYVNAAAVSADLAKGEGGEPLALYQVEAVVAGHRDEYPVEVLATSQAEAIDAATEMLSAKLAIDPELIWVLAAPEQLN